MKHSDLKTTQRYVHCDGVEDTSSRQWSREERKRRALDEEGCLRGSEVAAGGSPDGTAKAMPGDDGGLRAPWLRVVK